MARQATLGVESAYRTGNPPTPVACLSHVFVVAELEHQLVACLGVLSKCKATLGNTGAKTVVREGRRHDVEGDLVRRRRALCEKR